MQEDDLQNLYEYILNPDLRHKVALEIHKITNTFDAYGTGIAYDKLINSEVGGLYSGVVFDKKSPIKYEAGLKGVFSPTCMYGRDFECVIVTPFTNKEQIYKQLSSVNIKKLVFLSDIVSSLINTEKAKGFKYRVLLSANCGICGELVFDSQPAQFGEYFRQELGYPAGYPAQSWLCPHCQHVFSTPIIDNTNLANYYKDYLGSSYIEKRIAAEPNFKEQYSQYIDRDSEYTKQRLEIYRKNLKDMDKDGKFVVDFGGGDGFYSNTVFKNSSIEIFDVDAGYSEEMLARALERADILFSAHVFEHIQNPYEVLSKLTKYMKTGSLVYIEVPYDFSGSVVADFNKCRLYNNITGLIYNNPLVQFHEHLEHFSEYSIKKLLLRCSVAPVHSFITCGIIGIWGRVQPRLSISPPPPHG
jgi:hypothetical protein